MEVYIVHCRLRAGGHEYYVFENGKEARTFYESLLGKGVISYAAIVSRMLW